MGIGGPLNELPYSTDAALRLLQEMTIASITGDAEALQQAIQDWALLPVDEKRRIEDLVSMMPYPGLVPMQVSMIFSDPEKFIGAISRLGGPESAGLANALSGATVSSIVLAAVVSWLQSEQTNAELANEAAKKAATTTKSTTTTTSTSAQPQSKAPASEMPVVPGIASETSEVTSVASSPGTDTTAATSATSSTNEAEQVIAQAAVSDALTTEPLVTATPLTETPTSAVPSTSVGQSSTAAISETPVHETASAPQTTPSEAPTVPVSDNPINAALLAYIESGGNARNGGTPQPIDATQSLQFLRNNPILLSGLNTVDPSLLLRAYQIAEAQIIIGILDKIIEMQALLRQEQIQRDRRREAAELTPSQELLRNTRDDIRDGTQALSQTVLMAMQLLLINATAMQVGAVQPDQSAKIALAGGATTPIESVATVTSIVSSEAGLAVARQLFPNDVVATSVLVSIPVLFEGKPEQATSPELLAQLGVLASVYAQMVPYWSIPAAVSFQAQAGAVHEKSVTESAVRAFVVAIGTIINDPAFTLLIKNTVVRAMPALTEEQLKAFIAALKCGLLMNALVALQLVIIKKTGGQFSTKELADMILGKIPLPPEALEEGLIRQLQEQLKDIPEEYREDFIYRLLSCYSKNTDIESLIDPAKQFLFLCDQSLFHNTAASEGV